MIIFCVGFIGYCCFAIAKYIVFWKPISSWIGIVINSLCVVIYLNIIKVELDIRALKKRSELMKKYMCDFCGQELVSNKKSDTLEGGIVALFSSFELFRVKTLYKITRFSIQIPFGTSRNDMEVCSKCMTDFKEFVQRKQSYQGKDIR